MKKKILAAIFAGLMAFGTFGDVQAATREEIAAINVTRPADFKYWADKSTVKRQIINYVKDVTNPRSKNFIPVEDRIATFDMDGTFLCETAPTSLGYMFALYTMSENPDNPAYRDKLTVWKNAILSKNITPEMEKEFKDICWKLFDGKTDEEFFSQLEKFLTTQNVTGLTNLKYGESFYLPMIEIISYLNANDFTVYVITGSERRTTRGIINGVVPVQPNHIIGCDIPYKFENNGGEKYFVKGDRFLIGDHRLGSNTRINKIYSIKREIGKQPVLAFGNSSGDLDMLNYTITDNKYRSAAFMVLCDDYTREIGNKKLEDAMRQAAQKNGWTTISMKNDFKTIYGDNVKRIKN
ncbi:MAG: haloacid dehalogenase-like hydrolase [Selenomonadaceae bacterium]|nr:haloacid dehalogenase-like hydrolase [Selenomonadaceae bacterium]